MSGAYFLFLPWAREDWMSEGAFIRLDFRSSYPYKFWISDWNADESYPNGFRYKLLSSYSPETGLVELVLLLEEKNGDKTEMSRRHASLDEADAVAQVFVDGLSESYRIDFEEQDYSGAKTDKDFEILIRSFGGEAFNLH
jgi:hypothetical protein